MTKAWDWMLESPAPVWGVFVTAVGYAMAWTYTYHLDWMMPGY